MQRSVVAPRPEEDERRDDVRRAMVRADKRLARRIAAVEGDLEKIDAAERAAEHAPLFVAEAARARRGTTRLTALDWSSGEARTVTMELDPAKGPKEQVEALFRRARRMREGAAIALARLDRAERARAALAELRRALEDPEADLDALEKAAREAAPGDYARSVEPVPGWPPPGKRGRALGPRPPYRAFSSTKGLRLLVGRGAEDNDRLTLHVARPHHLWLHAKNRTGAHVVVALDKGTTCPSEVLVEAAHLAAHFSEARDEPLVEVQYTPRRYVRKPRGSAPGAVVVDREKVLLLRKDDAVLRGVLEREP